MSEESVLRRLTAVLAADVVGFSRLMGAHEVPGTTEFPELRTQYTYGGGDPEGHPLLFYAGRYQSLGREQV